MATKRKTTTKAATTGKTNTIPEETAKTIMDPDASTAEKQDALQGLADNLPEPEPEKEAPAAEGQDDQKPEPESKEEPHEPEPESAKEPQEQEKQDAPEPEPERKPEPITSDTPCPFEATVSVALAVLRKTTGLGTSEMLKPVATLKQGTKVTVTAVRDGGCMLRNGLWIAAEYLTKKAE